MSTLTVLPINQSIQAWQITPASSADLVDALNTIAEGGYSGTAAASPAAGGGSQWALTVTKSASNNQQGTIGAWIVFDGNYATVYQTNAEFIAAYTCNVPMAWSATSSAPIATAVGSTGATLTCPAPTSPNGPFTYAVDQTNANNTTIPVGTVSSSTVSGELTITLSGLALSGSTTFTIICMTPYGNTTSLPSNAIT